MNDSNAFSFWQLNKIIRKSKRGFYFILAEHHMQEQIAGSLMNDNVAVYNYSDSGKEKKFIPADIFRFIEAHPDKKIFFILNFQIPFLGKEVQPTQEDYFRLNMSRDLLNDYAQPLFFFMTPETERNISLVAMDFWSYVASKIRFASLDRQNTYQEIEKLSAEKDHLHFVPEIEERLSRYQEKIDEYLKMQIDPSDENRDKLLIAARDLLYIADLYSKIGSYHEAEKLLLKAITIREEVSGKEHPDTAAAYNNIGVVYDNQNEYDKALAYHEKALVICEKVLGAAHPDTATTYNNIAMVYDNMGDYDKALAYYEKALRIYEKVSGEEHPNTATTYNNIGRVFYTLGEYNKALDYYKKDLVISEKVLGAAHPDTATTYNNIGEVYRKQGDYDKALEYYGKALHIFEKVLGEDHPLTVTTYNNIALVYDNMDEYDKALAYYEKAYPVYLKVLGAAHPYTKGTYRDMADTYEKSGKSAPFEDWLGGGV